jgi:beta-mannosidase
VNGARDSARVVLADGWELARAGDTAWRAIGAPRPVAAVLAGAGEWSLDGPARRFDAEAWTYRLRLDAPSAVLAAGGRLVFEGLATCCDVVFNGATVLSARNMFRRHVVELPASAWRASGNELELRFEALDAHLAPRRPRPRWRAPMVEHQQLRFFRATLLGRTPGWSPAAAVVGPWRDVWLEPLDAAPCELVEQRAWLDGDAGRVRLALRLGDVETASAVLRDVDGVETIWPLLRGADGLHRGTGELAAARRWWPHTHGEPALHALALRVQPARGAAFEEPLGQVGFRTLEVDRAGDGFALRVNGQPVFARGACWVPADTLRLHASAGRYRELAATLRAAGANLVRVGGTMAYEDAAFFDACDEAGLMVWQEFMFASMDYPAADPAFAAEVAAEAAQQLGEWQRHACVAVVCGNSEVEQQAAMWGAERPAWTPALFHETLAAQVAAALPDVPYWPSSAHGGAFPFQPAAGTSSFYGVGAYLRPLDDARHSGLRFATECLAFAQVPDDAALARLAALQGGMPVRTHQPLWKERVPRDLGAGWDFDDVRDHYLEQQFGLPAADARRGDLPVWWALSRTAAAEAMASAFAQWRDPASACRGALVWFLRDLRAGGGWGVLDEQGHPKAAFHALAGAWQPRHVGLVDEGQNGLSAYVVNETPRLLRGVLALRFLHAGEVPVGRVECPLEIAAHGHWREPVLARAAGFLDLNGSYRFGPAAADTVVATLRDAAGATIAEAVHLVRAPGVPALQRRELGLQAQARRVGANVHVRLRTRVTARGVHFDAPGWRAGDEYFALAPDGEREVVFTPVAAASAPWLTRASAVNATGWTPAAIEEAA